MYLIHYEKMAQINLVQLNNNKRFLALQKLGYDLDEEGYVIDGSQKGVICKYSEEKVHINTAAILPGSIIVINATPDFVFNTTLSRISRNC